MRRSFTQLALSAVVAATTIFSASTALASVICHDKAGREIVISDPSSCSFEVSGGCTVDCTPLKFAAECNAQCSGMCTASADVSCTGSCGGSCQAQCMANPGSFDCEASCNTNCQASCKAGDTQATCQANCKTDCRGQCTAVPPSADCNAKCQGCCSGSCTAQANLDCDVMCSGSCEASLTGGCTGACSSPQGALFCDGQFIDISSVGDCEFEIKIEASANVKTSCAATPTGGSAPFSVGAVGLALAGVGLAAARRRRNKK